MRITIFGLLILASFLLHSAEAADRKCPIAQWPYSRVIADLKPQDLAGVPRSALYAYLYFELSSNGEQRVPGLAKMLFKYLRNTELNEDRVNLIQALEFATGDDLMSVNVMSRTELCSLESTMRSLPSKVRSKKEQK